VVAGLRRGLAETDFVEGRNVALESRWGEGQLDRTPSLLARSPVISELALHDPLSSLSLAIRSCCSLGCLIRY
jgi:hypothetical protein